MTLKSITYLEKINVGDILANINRTNEYHMLVTADYEQDYFVTIPLANFDPYWRSTWAFKSLTRFYYKVENA